MGPAPPPCVESGYPIDCNAKCKCYSCSNFKNYLAHPTLDLTKHWLEKCFKNRTATIDSDSQACETLPYEDCVIYRKEIVRLRGKLGSVKSGIDRFLLAYQSKAEQKARDIALEIKAELDEIVCAHNALAAKLWRRHSENVWDRDFLAPSGDLIAYFNFVRRALIIINLSKNRKTLIDLPKSEVLCSAEGSLHVGPSVVVAAESVFIMGGTDLKTVTGRVLRIPFTKPGPSLHKMADMLLPKYSMTVTQLSDRFIYAIGGKTSCDQAIAPLPSCECYDIKLNKWTAISPIQQPRSNAAICTFHGRFIYLYGGSHAQSDSKASLEMYDVLDGEKGWIDATIIEPSPLLQNYTDQLVPISDHEILLVDNINGGYTMECDAQGRISESKKLTEYKTQDKYFNLFFNCSMAVHHHWLYSLKRWEDTLYLKRTNLLNRLANTVNMDDPTW